MQFQIFDCRSQIAKSSSAIMCKSAVINLKSQISLSVLCGYDAQPIHSGGFDTLHLIRKSIKGKIYCENGRLE